MYLANLSVLTFRIWTRTRSTNGSWRIGSNLLSVESVNINLVAHRMYRPANIANKWFLENWKNVVFPECHGENIMLVTKCYKNTKLSFSSLTVSMICSSGSRCPSVTVDANVPTSCSIPVVPQLAKLPSAPILREGHQTSRNRWWFRH